MKSIIRSASGPWGSVRVEIINGTGMWSVHTWINGYLQKPAVGLEKDEAIELADATIDRLVIEMTALKDNQVSEQEVTDFLGRITTITPADDVVKITKHVNAAFMHFTKARKLEEAGRYLIHLRVEAVYGTQGLQALGI